MHVRDGGAEVLSLRGWLDDTGLLRLSGQSSAGWTWRLELDCPEPGQLELRDAMSLVWRVLLLWLGLLALFVLAGWAT